MYPPTTLLVLNHNGAELLRKYLPSVLRAADEANGDHQVWLVDNASSDDSVDFVRKELPRVRLFCHGTNDYLFSLNDAVRACDTDTVVLLNNDLEPAPNFLSPLLEPFGAPDVFAVASKTFGPDRKTLQYARVSGHFAYGLLYSEHKIEQDTETDPEGPVATLYASGGASAFDRKKFLALGGFDRTYWPIYAEDVDLSYKAWMRGWRSLYQPNSIVFHEHNTTMRRREGQSRIDALRFRNSFLLTWRNVRDPWILADSLRTWTHYLRRALTAGERWRLVPLLEAALRLPRAVGARRLDRRERTDRWLIPTVYETWPGGLRSKLTPLPSHDFGPSPIVKDLTRPARTLPDTSGKV